MKRLLPVLAVICIALIPFAAHAAQSPGVNLAWDDCYKAGTRGATNKDFACNTNVGIETLFGSFVAFATPAPLDTLLQVNGMEAVIDLISAADPLPDWWKMGSTSPGACAGRTTTTPVSDFSFVAGPFNCLDYWAGGASGGINYTFPFGPTNASRRARIRLVCAIPEASAGRIEPGTEVYSFKVLITRARTVGTPSCAGCTVPVCLVLNSIKVTQNVGFPADTMSGPGATGNDRATWQGGAGADCQLVPAVVKTWGQVKSLYR